MCYSRRVVHTRYILFIYSICTKTADFPRVSRRDMHRVLPYCLVHSSSTDKCGPHSRNLAVKKTRRRVCGKIISWSKEHVLSGWRYTKSYMLAKKYHPGDKI